ncbi:MAG: DUF3500 domain-containing protein [Acidobacteriia bacterium]|nr:DUF3500 domain-containing protein [Terriglobia bacterium]
MDRRDFLKQAALAAAASGSVSAAETAPKATNPETLVATLYHSLTEEQRPKVCFPFGHELQSKVDANWFITPHRIERFYTKEQQAMIEEIFRKLHNPDFVGKVMQHMQEDGAGLGNYTIALFGEPAKTGKSKFEFVLTGRHCTVRCDGDSVAGAAFGGPIMYGHQAGPSGNEQPTHPNNVYWYQAVRANEVFQALSGKQREQALLSEAPRPEKASSTVALNTSNFSGIPVADMARDQRELVEKVLADLLLPFRKKDTAEAMQYIRAQGGVSSLHMSFFKSLDIGNDGVWDVWQLESPHMVWYFRGYPHVHTWVNIRA